jgi:hypothetical protein
MLDYINKLLCCVNNDKNENVILHQCCYNNNNKKNIISTKSKNHSNEIVFDKKFGDHSSINNIKQELENKMQFKNEKRRGVRPRIPV